MEKIIQRLFDDFEVMLLDPRLDEVVIGCKHQKTLAHRLGNEAREKGVDLRCVDVVVRLHLFANVVPIMVEFRAVHISLPSLFEVSAIVYKKTPRVTVSRAACEGNPDEA